MGVLHATPLTTESGLEGLAAATVHPMSPSTSSPSTGNIATIRTPSHGTIDHVETATISAGNDINVSSALDFLSHYHRMLLVIFR
jgi:hypothetical protein